MTKIENRKKLSGINLKPIGAGLALAVIIITVILFIGAILISGEKVPEKFGGTIICIAAFLGAMCGGVLSGKKNKGSFVLTGLTVGIILFCIRMITSAFNTDSQFFDSSAIKILIFLLAGGFFGGLMAGRKRKRRKK